MSAEQVIAETLDRYDDERWPLTKASHVAAALRAAGYLTSPDEVSVPREALRNVLDYARTASHYINAESCRKQGRKDDPYSRCLACDSSDLLARLDSGEPA